MHVKGLRGLCKTYWTPPSPVMFLIRLLIQQVLTCPVIPSSAWQSFAVWVCSGIGCTVKDTHLKWILYPYTVHAIPIRKCTVGLYSGIQQF